MEKRGIFLLMMSVFVIIIFVLPIVSSIELNQTDVSSQLIITKYDSTVYASKNIMRSVYIDIKNTGTTDLNEVMVSIEKLTIDNYDINPNIINLIKPGETKTVEVDFLVKDITGENELVYVVKSGKIRTNQSATLVVLGVLDYSKMEIDSLEEKIIDIKNNYPNNPSLNGLNRCEDYLNKSRFNLEKEEYIDLQNNINKTGNCLVLLEKKLNEKPLITLPTPQIKIDLGAIIIWVLILSIILLGFFIIYGFYRKFSLISFYEKKEKTKVDNTPQSSINLDYFNDKIKRIDDNLSGK